MPKKAKNKLPWKWLRIRTTEEKRHRFHLACLREKLTMNHVIETYMEKFSEWSEKKGE